MNLIFRLEQEFSIKYNAHNIRNHTFTKFLKCKAYHDHHNYEEKKKNINVQQDFYAGGIEIYSACLLK